MYCVLNERLCISLFVSLCILLFSSDLGQSIFYTTTCLLPFLSDDILSTLPYTMISTLATFPPFLHKDIIEYLSTSFLPMAIREYPPCHLTKRPVFQASSTALFSIQRHNLIHLNHTEIKPVTFFVSLPYYCWSAVGSTRREGGVPAYVNLSASSMLMIAMQYTSNPGNLSHWLGSTDGNTGCNCN